MKVAVDLGFVKTICLYRPYETPNYLGDSGIRGLLQQPDFRLYSDIFIIQIWL